MSAVQRAMAPALSPADILAVRTARYRQSQAGDMLAALEGTGAACERPRTPAAAVGDPPEDAAEREAQGLGLPTFASGSEAPAPFDRIRDALERRADVLVFQGIMDAESVRTVVLAPNVVEWNERKMRPSPYTIMVNAGDNEGTRRFSLLHGYGHVLLGAAGSEGKGGSHGGCICKEDGRHLRSWPPPDTERSGTDRAEEWCDSFAAAALMPYQPFLHELERIEGEMDLARYDMEWDGPAGTRVAAGRLSERFGTSAYAVAVRATDMPQTMKKSRYRRLVAETANTRRGASRGAPARIGNGGDAAARRLSRFGRRFARIVASAYHTGEATNHDAMELLDIGFDDIADVQAAAWD